MTAIEQTTSNPGVGPAPGSAVWAAVDQGARQYRADATACRRGRYRMAVAVADGVGDSLDAAWSGQVAADTAARAGLAVSAPEALAEARDVVASVDPAGAGDSALVVAVGECATGWDIAWVGDCRAWTWRNGTLEQVTTDHTVAEGMRQLGVGAPPPSAEHILTSSLRCRLVPDGTVTLGPGPLLLTSDGVHKSLRRSEIEAVLSADPGDPCEAMLAAARLAGSRDNAAALLITPVW
jgi:hypothetical protein